MESWVEWWNLSWFFLFLLLLLSSFVALSFDVGIILKFIKSTWNFHQLLFIYKQRENFFPSSRCSFHWCGCDFPRDFDISFLLILIQFLRSSFFMRNRNYYSMLWFYSLPFLSFTILYVFVSPRYFLASHSQFLVSVSERRRKLEAKTGEIGVRVEEKFIFFVLHLRAVLRMDVGGWGTLNVIRRFVICFHYTYPLPNRQKNHIK